MFKFLSNARSTTRFLRIRVGLRTQIALLGIVGVILTGLISLAGLHLDDQARSEAEQMSELRQHVIGLSANYLEAGEIANEFLRKPDERLVPRHAAVLESALAHLSAIEAFVDPLPVGDDLKQNSALRAGVGLYRTRFNNIVSIQRTLGLNQNTGFHGKLGAAVREAEGKLAGLDQPRLTNLMLMMRGHEKDFMLRAEEKDRGLFDKRRSEFDDALSSSGLPEAARSELSALVKAYGESFAAYVATRSTLSDELDDLATVFERNRPSLDRLVEAAGDRSRAAALRAEQVRRILTWTIAGATVCIGLLAILFGQRIASLIARMTQAMQKLASGDFSVALPGLDRTDEVGDMANAVETFKIRARQKADEETQMRLGQERLATEARQADMNRLADQFESAVGQMIETVAAAAAELEGAAGTLTSNASRSADATRIAAAESQEASANAQSIASATEQMSSSVSEVGRQVHQSAQIATEAVEQAEKTNSQVAELLNATGKIGEVVQLISAIARQTNLLALNATIEAARAGSAGRGFSVVASEVKALSQQTAQATDEITEQINGIQSATENAVESIKAIGGTIGKMSEIASTIAAAVEEQGAATLDISRNVQLAAEGTQRVTHSILDVQHGASETGSASAQVLSAAKTLSSGSSRLKLEVATFLATVRAA